MNENTNTRHFIVHNEAEWLVVKQQPRVDQHGRRRPLVCTEAVVTAVNSMDPRPTWALRWLHTLVFHLSWPKQLEDGKTLCDIRATRQPNEAIEFPFLCGTCAWKMEIATGQELIE